MYRLRGLNRIDKRLFIEHQHVKEHVKEHVIKDCINNFVHEMNDRRSLDIVTIEVNDNYFNEIEVRVEGFIATKKEYIEMLEIINLIKIYLPDDMKDYACRLYTILTQEPEEINQK